MKNKLLNISAYLGFASELYLFDFTGEENTTLRFHLEQGLFLYLLLLPTSIFWVFVQVLEVAIVINFPNIGLSTLNNLILIMDGIAGIPFVVWFVFWLVSIIQASRSTAKPRNANAKKLADRVLIAFSVGWGIFLQLVVIFVIFAIMRANQLTNKHNENASVYLLYGNLGKIPRWVFATGFYPIAEIAHARWGEGSVSVEPLTKESLDNAIQNGRLIVIASHGGQEGTIALSRGYYSPSNVYQIGGSGPNLQYVYISGCKAGTLESDWVQSLTPAKVITFNRYSAATEHALWLWTGGIKVALEIK